MEREILYSTSRARGNMLDDLMCCKVCWAISSPASDLASSITFLKKFSIIEAIATSRRLSRPPWAEPSRDRIERPRFPKVPRKVVQCELSGQYHLLGNPAGNRQETLIFSNFRLLIVCHSVFRQAYSSMAD